MQIRAATGEDADGIRGIYLSAFPDSESMVVAELAVDLLAEDSTPPTLSLLAESDGSMLGHVAFSPVSLESGADFHGYILAPLAVRPNDQKCGIGSQLVESGMRQLSERGVDVVFVYGDPEYYKRFGFGVEAARDYLPPYKLQHPFGWQAIFLREIDREEPREKITCVTSLRDPTLW
ncbi:MAG: GNAT family N-acetyltransferase [Verrucomicrobiales bacterium]